MRSKASLKSHPLHPILVCFPLAFFIGAFIFDLLAFFSKAPALRTTSYHLVIAGIIGAVLAALPGLLDFIYTVPPHSSGKKRAAKHGLLNTANLLLFVAIYFLKRNDNPDFRLITVLEGVGTGILFVAGWLGGTLVYRNQIGVDPRYAGAGKWNEAYLPTESGLVQVATTEELKPDQMKLVHVNGCRIVIGRSDNGYSAFGDHCTHRGGSLAGGTLICGTVQCPWHGSQFDIYKGTVRAGPAKEKLVTYPLVEKNGALFLDTNLIN